MSFPEEMKLNFIEKMKLGEIRRRKGRHIRLSKVRGHWKKYHWVSPYLIYRGVFQAAMSYYIHKYTKLK